MRLHVGKRGSGNFQTKPTNPRPKCNSRNATDNRLSVTLRATGAERQSSAAAAAGRAVNSRGTSRAAAVRCSAWFGSPAGEAASRAPVPARPPAATNRLVLDRTHSAYLRLAFCLIALNLRAGRLKTRPYIYPLTPWPSTTNVRTPLNLPPSRSAACWPTFSANEVPQVESPNAEFPRARQPQWPPVATTVAGVRTVFDRMVGTDRLPAERTSGFGVGAPECRRLRDKSVDFGRHRFAVRNGEGETGRVVPLPRRLGAKLGRCRSSGWWLYSSLWGESPHRRRTDRPATTDLCDGDSEACLTRIVDGVTVAVLAGWSSYR